MARGITENAILNKLYRGTVSIDDFCWDAMTTVPILYLMSPEDIEYIRRLILSPRYSGNNKLKMEKIDEVMHRRGFTRYAGGTNRLVYIHPSAPNAVFKVAIDSVGIDDNPAEFRNQRFLKPYCCKVFECSPCGTIASFEKVSRITTFEEFYTIADDYFYLLSRIILGKYVMEDIGVNFFMNVGIRIGWGIVLLDFPYLFELDGAKLECCNKLDDDSICHGEIDYDHGFNNLICKKCGRIYRARDLAKPPESSGILLKQKGAKRMKLSLKRGNQVVKTYDTTIERDHLSKCDKDVVGTTTVGITLNKVKVAVPAQSTCVVKKTSVSPKHVEEKKVVDTTNKKTVVKSISISLSEKESSEVARKTSIPINLVKKEVKVPVKNIKKTVPAIAKESSVESKISKETSVNSKKEDTKVATRVINLSIGKTPKVDPINRETTCETKIRITKTSSKPVEEVKKEEPVKVEPVKEEVVETPAIVEEPKVEEPVVEPTVEQEPIEETPVIEELSPVVEEQTEPEESEPEKIKETEEEVVEETVEEDVVQEESEEEIQEEHAEEVVEEESIEEESSVEEAVEETAEEVVEDTVVEEEEESTEAEVQTEVEEIAKEVEETVIENLKADEEVAEEESSEEQVEEHTAEETTEETVKEEETENSESEEVVNYDVSFVTELPADEEAEENVFYCLYDESEIDVTAYKDVTDPRLLDVTLFEIYMLVEDELTRIIYNFDEDEWECYEEEYDEVESQLDNEDDLINEVISKSSGKLSAKDFE